MTSYGLATPAVNNDDWWTEVKATMRDALRHPVVLSVVALCATLVALAFLGIMGWLLYAQRDATMMMTALNTIISVFLIKKVSDVDGRVRGVEQQTNGHTTRLMDAALKDNK